MQFAVDMPTTPKGLYHDFTHVGLYWLSYPAAESTVLLAAAAGLCVFIFEARWRKRCSVFKLSKLTQVLGVVLARVRPAVAVNKVV